MAIASSVNLSTNTSESIKNRYYDTLFLKIAEKKLVHKQLGQLNRKVAKGQGGFGSGSIYWTRWTNLPVVSAGQGEGVPTTAIQMTAVNVTGTTGQYDAAVSISDILAYASFGDVMKSAVERLAYNAGLSIDTIVRNEIKSSGTAQQASAAAAVTAIPAAAYLNIGEIRKTARTLNRNDAQTLSDGSWAAVVHPDALYDLQGDSTTGGWIDANKYTEGNASKLMSGEVGKLMGVRFLETSNGATQGTALTASATIYTTSVFGSDAFGVTELQNLKTYIHGFGSGGVADPTNKVSTAGWKTTFGAATLNDDFFINLNHTVSTTA